MQTRQRGAALVPVLLFGALLAVGIFAFRALFDFALFSQMGAVQEYGARSLAMAGQEEARARLQERDYDLAMPTWTHHAPQAGFYTVAITRPHAEQRLVRSTGTLGGRSMTIERLYSFTPASWLRVPLLIDGDITLAGVTSIGAPMRSNGSISLGATTSIDPAATVTASGSIRLDTSDCLLPQCRAHSPRLSLPMPAEEAVRQGAYEIVLTAANTRSGLYYIGGSSGGNRAGFAQDSTDSRPYDFRTQPNQIYIRSGDGGSYRVRFSTLIYAGSGTIATASTGITVEFAGGNTPIRRAEPLAAGSSFALLPFQLQTVVTPANFTFEGVLITHAVALGNNAEINGALVARTLDPASSQNVKGLTLRSDPDILLHVPPQVPQAIDTSASAPIRP